MTVPVLRLRQALTAALGLAVALAACGGGETPAERPPLAENPRAVLGRATLEGIESGNLDLAIDITVPGEREGTLLVTAFGPFRGQGERGPPRLDFSVTASGRLLGRPVDFERELALPPERARDAGADSLVTCLEELGGLDVAAFVENGRNIGTGPFDGTTLTAIVGKLDVAGATDALLAVIESPPCRDVPAFAGLLPSGAEVEELEHKMDRVTATDVEAFVGDDDIVRRMQVKTTFEPTSRRGPKIIEAAIDVKLSGVNEEQAIPGPAGTGPPAKRVTSLARLLEELRGKLAG